MTLYTYAPDATMQAMLSDKNGRVLIIEPGLGFKLEQAKYSLITNYSVLSPEITKPYIVSGDDRFERADELLKSCNDSFSVGEAFQILKSVKQEGLWATRVSFVYSVSMKNQWILCPVCGSKTRDRLREDTVLKNYPLYCPKCKQETLINVKELHITVIKEPDTQMQSR